MPTASAAGLHLGAALLHNVRQVETVEGGIRTSRLDAATLAQVEAKTAAVAANGTACELRFRLRGPEARLRLRTLPPQSPRPDNALAEVWFGSVPGAWQYSPIALGTTWSELRIPHPDGTRLQHLRPDPHWSPDLVRVRLPYDRACEISAISGDVEPPRPEDMPARRLCCYGSSITHGSSALLPSATGMWQAADALGLDLLNLGFPGSALLEPAIARLIAADPSWHLATAELGINVLGMWTPEQFAAKVEAFLAELARAGRPVLVTDLYLCGSDEGPSERITAYRAIVAAACQRHGLRHVDGRSLLGGWHHLTADLVHPSLAGMNALGARWAEAIRPLL